jgi:secondary thiamine-phosphate synthase enzyme
MGNPQLEQAITTLTVKTRGPGMIEFTTETAAWLAGESARDGILNVFIRHTSASLTIQENADRDVQSDLIDALDGLAPVRQGYRHNSEGPDDMPAHIKAAITSTSLSVPVQNGRMLLGTWQGLYVIEHRAQPHTRNVALHFLGNLAP